MEREIYMSVDNKSFICNLCGKEIKAINGISKEDFIILKKQWGYFSAKDGQVHEICICEACYDDWIKTFKMPPQRSNAVELI